LDLADLRLSVRCLIFKFHLSCLLNMQVLIKTNRSHLYFICIKFLRLSPSAAVVVVISGNFRFATATKSGTTTRFFPLKICYCRLFIVLSFAYHIFIARWWVGGEWGGVGGWCNRKSAKPSNPY
jgi:hypothetical protein